MSMRKKIAALLASLVVVFSASGCGTGKNTAWSARYENYETTAGIFIYYEMSAYYQALNQAKGENAELDTSDTKALKSTQIDGKDMLTWIQDEATENLRKYLAVQAEFDNRGLELSADDISTINEAVKTNWEYYGSYYEQNGIGKESFTKITELSYKSSALFESYYAEGGTDEVPTDDIKEYYDENYARVKFIEMDLTDTDGNELDDDAKEERKKLAEDYIKRANNGEDFNSLADEYNQYLEELEAEAEAEAESETEEEDVISITEETVSDETESEDNISETEKESSEEIEVEVTEAEASNEESTETESADDDDEEISETDSADDDDEEISETDSADDDDEEISETDSADDDDETSETDSGDDADPYTNEQIIKKVSDDDEDSSYLPSEIVNKAIFESKDFGNAYFVDDTDNNKYYIVVRYDILERDDLFEGDSLLSILNEMKGDDYNNKLLEIVTADNIILNDASYKRYDPFKFEI
jgi:hypothetical protein